MATKFNLDLFKESIDFFRGKLQLFSKLLHNLHFNILVNFSEIANIEKGTNPKEEKIINSVLESIVTDLRSCFSLSMNYKPIYEEFKLQRFIDVEIQELITKIAANISGRPELFYHLVDNSSLFTYDFIDYINKISKAGKEKSTLLYNLSDGRSKVNNDKSIYSLFRIVEYSAQIILQVFNSHDQVINDFVGKV